MKIWECKIGEITELPPGADGPLRTAIEIAYRNLTGEEPTFCFSGWNGKLTKIQREIVEENAIKTRVRSENYQGEYS